MGGGVGCGAYILSKNENFTWYYTDLYMFAFIIETLEAHLIISHTGPRSLVDKRVDS